jgi:thiamine pyrophosphokinase
VTGALGGRFDHEAANLNVLYVFSDMRIILLSDDCQIRLLPKTYQHEIHIQSTVEGPHCGLFPIGGPSVSTTTTGLTWNLCMRHVLIFLLALLKLNCTLVWAHRDIPYQSKL